MSISAPGLRPPAVRLDLHRSFYPVIGATAHQLHAVLQTLGPVRAGRRFGAFTDWEIAWRYQHADDHEGHRIHEVSVEVRATITSPIWKPSRSALRGLVSAWKEYAAAIETHEQGHLALAVEAADAIRARLIALPAFSSKTAIEEVARAVAEEELRIAREREISYDRTTCHGRSQGVVFPSENTCSAEDERPQAVRC